MLICNGKGVILNSAMVLRTSHIVNLLCSKEMQRISGDVFYDVNAI